MKLLYGMVFAFLAMMLCCGNALAQGSCSGLEGNDPEISGLYIDNFAGWHSVGGEAWFIAADGGQLIFHVCNVDNSKNFLITQNDVGNDFNPGKFSRFEWYEDHGKLFYCQQVFDATTETDAADFAKTPAANSSNANDEGCGAKGQFAWSQLILVRQ
ncbi:hypothetical protein [Rhizobium sp. WYJ-E13]|uniref:hypothetical protein n=1 Tax=Rhizobium sp. WYJ-E13 TaxID=2849093 RepID=UPI001C1EF317|nr:hypothetical protein [Rhizobium sp. WYJ-E13]QWW67950.1 hypothetical protein KQ933_20590 [Rhizobium sp. WYJ-E13]